MIFGSFHQGKGLQRLGLKVVMRLKMVKTVNVSKGRLKTRHENSFKWEKMPKIAFKQPQSNNKDLTNFMCQWNSVLLYKKGCLESSKAASG